MKGYNDQWIKDRILWAASKNGLPTGITSIYEDSDNLPSDLKRNAHRTGIPVLTIVSGENCWTVLGTDKIIANDNGIIQEINLDDITEIHWPTEAEVPVKKDCDFVTVRTVNGTDYRLKVPVGREFFAFYNILLRLNKLQKTQTPP